PGVNYYKVGVGLLDLSNGEHEQFDMLNPTPNNTELMRVFDGINQKYGTDSLFLGAQGINEKWGMRRDRLTPQYTTRWNDVPKIRC
ncbi:MAG: DUF4113 domain-containing protein, partial [Gammaproteobacteria bacterium]|nr:DUF4113 domain-containing protein [Gammaproteobacteria bacterium]